MATLDSLFRQFLRERSYLKHVSPKTRVWYETAWATFLRTQPAGLATTPINGTAPITRQRLNAFVVALRDRRVRPVTCNAWLRSLNAYCRWLHDEGILAEPTKLPPVEAGEAVREDAGRTGVARDSRVQAERTLTVIGKGDKQRWSR